MALLEVRNVTRRFGGIVALDDVSFDVGAGQISGLIGPNGAGKTTVFNVITRLYRLDAGQVVFDGSSLLRTAPHKVVKRGVARTFQNVELFSGMSVLDNVLVGTHARSGWFGERRARRRALEALEEVGAAEFASRPAVGLPFGTLKRVELARALAAEPRLLLLDEPAGGLNHEEVDALGGLIRRIRKHRDLTILLVEHHMSLVMSVSDRVQVLDFGRKIAEGTPAEVQRNPAVIEAYLGGGAAIALLELKGVEARYGPVQALHGVSLTVDAGEMVAVLGPNGAGKTTTLRAVSGTVARRGEVVFDGRRLARSAEQAARLGIAHVPEGRGTFSELTVLENLRLGAYTRRNGLGDSLELVLEFFPWMRARRDQPAGTLSGGEQQMLALARALMSRPRLLLLDEPSLGLAPIVVREIFGIVRRLNEEEKLSVLVVEQNAAVALESSSRAYVLEAGKVAFEGPSEELGRNEDVRRSYLGY